MPDANIQYTGNMDHQSVIKNCLMLFVQDFWDFTASFCRVVEKKSIKHIVTHVGESNADKNGDVCHQST